MNTIRSLLLVLGVFYVIGVEAGWQPGQRLLMFISDLGSLVSGGSSAEAAAPVSKQRFYARVTSQTKVEFKKTYDKYLSAAPIQSSSPIGSTPPGTPNSAPGSATPAKDAPAPVENADSATENANKEGLTGNIGGFQL